MAYSRKAVIDWFHKTLGVDRLLPDGHNIQTACPQCGGDVFYFSAKKQIGICHKASCNYRPNIHDLIEIVGFPPGVEGIYDKEEEETRELGPLTLPGWPILQMINGQLMTTNLEALEYLRGRGLTDQVITNWRLTCDGERIFVPIYSEGVLVNYNSRLLPSCSDRGKKYLYAEGRFTGKYILGWEECRDWTQLSLVENTFVSLSLRSDLRCTTTFGSNISTVQARLMGESRVRTVAILWDEGADKKADIAIRKLHDKGIKAAYWRIRNQPDDYPKEQVIEWAEQVFEAASKGIPYVDFK